MPLRLLLGQRRARKGWKKKGPTVIFKTSKGWEDLMKEDKLNAEHMGAGEEQGCVQQEGAHW